MRYKCIHDMEIELYDADCCRTGSFGMVEEGSIWHESDADMISGEVHLECESGCDDAGWIEITRADLKECFEAIN